MSGGCQNKAYGLWSSIGGGIDNTAQGSYATISGGSEVNLGTDYGWAAGIPGDPAVAPFNQAWFLSPLITVAP